MGKRKENENLAGELAESFAQWENLKEHGGSDPFYADGTNMNLVRNHIMYYKNRMVEEYGADYEKYPVILARSESCSCVKPQLIRAFFIARPKCTCFSSTICSPPVIYCTGEKKKGECSMGSC